MIALTMCAPLAYPMRFAKVVGKSCGLALKKAPHYKAGKDKAIGFLVGQIMKKSRGKANPGMVTKMLKEKMQ